MLPGDSARAGTSRLRVHSFKELRAASNVYEAQPRIVLGTLCLIISKESYASNDEAHEYFVLANDSVGWIAGCDLYDVSRTPSKT